MRILVNTTSKVSCGMSTLFKLIVLAPLVTGILLTMQACKNGPPPVMLVRHVLKRDKDENLGQIAPGTLLKLEKSADGTATVGENFKVSLPSKSGDGHAWTCRTTDDPYLLVDAAFETEPAGAIAFDSETHTIYSLHARAVGKAKIEFVLLNNTETHNAPSQTIALNVEVKAAASK